MEALAMTGGKLREAMDLLRSLKQQYPDDSDEVLQQRFRKELESDPAIRRAIIEDIYRKWLQELTERKTY
jgi:ADP-heptose:LPS heptosyltransferase